MFEMLPFREVSRINHNRTIYPESKASFSGFLLSYKKRHTSNLALHTKAISKIVKSSSNSSILAKP